MLTEEMRATETNGNRPLSDTRGFRDKAQRLQGGREQMVSGECHGQERHIQVSTLPDHLVQKCIHPLIKPTNTSARCCTGHHEGYKSSLDL